MSGNVLVVGGVSGCGKSTVGAALADRIGATFIEGDSYHSPENIDAMASGQPLDDAMRAPWLARLAEISAQAAQKGDVVLACSALARRYRDQLRDGIGTEAGVGFIILTADAETLRARMTTRPGHFMPASLLDSQIATQELPDLREGGTICISAELTLEEITKLAFGFAQGLARSRSPR